MELFLNRNNLNEKMRYFNIFNTYRHKKKTQNYNELNLFTSHVFLYHYAYISITFILFYK